MAAGSPCPSVPHLSPEGASVKITDQVLAWEKEQRG
jgi:hypothetical protein